MSKLYPCKECGKEVPIRSKGLCPVCREKQRRDAGEETMSTRTHSITKMTPKRQKKLTDKKKVLDPFFAYHIEQIKKTPYCRNCGDSLIGIRSEVAHVLPKRETMNPEVMNNLDNAMYLCSQVSNNNCHKQFDDNQASEIIYNMQVWEEAVSKYVKLKPFIVNQNKITKTFDNYLESSKK